MLADKLLTLERLGSHTTLRVIVSFFYVRELRPPHILSGRVNNTTPWRTYVHYCCLWIVLPLGVSQEFSSPPCCTLQTSFLTACNKWYEGATYKFNTDLLSSISLVFLFFFMSIDHCWEDRCFVLYSTGNRNRKWDTSHDVWGMGGFQHWAGKWHWSISCCWLEVCCFITMKRPKDLLTISTYLHRSWWHVVSPPRPTGPHIFKHYSSSFQCVT